MRGHDPKRVDPERGLGDLEVVAGESPAVAPEDFMVHAAFESQTDAAGRTRYLHPTECEGMLQIVDRSHPVLWEVRCAECGFEVGVNLMRSDPERMIAYRLERAGIPEAFSGKVFDKDEPEQQQTLGACRAWVRGFKRAPLPAVALYGQPGRGKSHLLVLMVETLIRQYGADAMYRSASAMFDELRSAMDTKGGELVWQRILDVGVLALDDVGAGRSSDWTTDRLAALVDHRYAKELPLLIATNVPPVAWERAFGDRTASRLRGMCIPLKLAGPDRRAQGVQERFACEAA